jgi:hypothetical protein
MQNCMKMVGKNRVGADINGKNRGQEKEFVFNPLAAVLETDALVVYAT